MSKKKRSSRHKKLSYAEQRREFPTRPSGLLHTPEDRREKLFEIGFHVRKEREKHWDPERINRVYRKRKERRLLRDLHREHRRVRRESERRKFEAAPGVGAYWNKVETEIERFKVCKDRKRRREALFALRHVGKGIGGSKLKTYLLKSLVRC